MLSYPLPLCSLESWLVISRPACALKCGARGPVTVSHLYQLCNQGEKADLPHVPALCFETLLSWEAGSHSDFGVRKAKV